MCIAGSCTHTHTHIHSPSSMLAKQLLCYPVVSGHPVLPVFAALEYDYKKHDLSFHFYADDVQLYLPLRHNESSALTKLLDCLND